MKPLVNKKYLLQKFPGKGGWTYAAIPEILQDKSKPFGWVTVKGSIDDYQLQRYKLMPMGDGKLFLPVKKAIRASIKKEAGDTVHIILYKDDSRFITPQEILDCLENEDPIILKKYEALKDGEKKSYVDWINQAKQDDTKVERVAHMIKELESL